MKIFMYDNMCVFVFGTAVEILSIFFKQTVSEVIRAEAETCFLTVKINLLMLLLILLTFFNSVLTKVPKSEVTIFGYKKRIPMTKYSPLVPSVIYNLYPM